MSQALLHETGPHPRMSAAAGAPNESRGAPVSAQVRAVVPLRPDQESRLRATLERLTGQPISLDVQQDPSILGGVWVRIGDVVIDGSLRARLEALDEILCAQCHLLLVAEDAPTRKAR